MLLRRSVDFLAEIPAVGLASVLNPELPAGLGGLGAEDGLVQAEAVGQSGERHTLEIIRVQGPEKGDGTPANMSVVVQLGEVRPFNDSFNYCQVFQGGRDCGHKSRPVFLEA